MANYSVSGLGRTNAAQTGDFALARYNKDGSLDRSFGNNGVTLFDLAGINIGFNIAIQPNHKIVVVGWSGANLSDPVGSISSGTVLRYEGGDYKCKHHHDHDHDDCHHQHH